MKRRATGRAPSRAEFDEVTQAELGFLVSEYGFAQSVSPADPWRIEFRRERCCIALIGGGYGQSARFEIEIDGQQVFWVEVCPSYATRFTPTTDCPQLDDIRESAHRLRGPLAPFLHGDYGLAEEARRRGQEREAAREARRAADPRGTFFSRADALWKNEKTWAEFVAHLEHASEPLTPTWQARLVAAQKRLDGR